MKAGVIKLYFTFENCIIKYLFVFYRTRSRAPTRFRALPFRKARERTVGKVSSGEGRRTTNLCAGDEYQIIKLAMNLFRVHDFINVSSSPNFCIRLFARVLNFKVAKTSHQFNPNPDYSRKEILMEPN